MSRISRMTMCRLVALAAALLVWPAGAVSAHEEGVLKLERREFAPGDSVGLAGRQFGKRAELKIMLAGAGGRIEVAAVRADTAGAFTATVRIPDDAAPGAYRLVALAADGDEVAALDVAVVPAAAPAAHEMHDESSREPAHEPLALDRARSPSVTVGVLITIGFAGIVGAVLLRRPRGA